MQETLTAIHFYIERFGATSLISSRFSSVAGAKP